MNKVHQPDCPGLQTLAAINAACGTIATFLERTKLEKNKTYRAALQALNIIRVWLEGRPVDLPDKVFRRGWTPTASYVEPGTNLVLDHDDPEVVNLAHWMLYCRAIHNDACSRLPFGVKCHHYLSFSCTCPH